MAGPQGALIGPGFALDSPNPSLAVVVRNASDFSWGVGGPNQHVPDTPAGRALNWCRSTASPPCNGDQPGGNYTATSFDGATVSFSIDAANRLGPTSLTLTTIREDLVEARWTAAANARSFYVYLQAA